jgi:hypothetical protein
MEPTTGLLIGAGAATAGWLLGRAAALTPENGTPGDAVAETGTRLAREGASTITTIGTRAAITSGAAIVVAGSVLARTAGSVVDASYGAMCALLRRGVTPEQVQVEGPTEEGLPATERTSSGLDVPLGSDTR